MAYVLPCPRSDLGKALYGEYVPFRDLARVSSMLSLSKRVGSVLSRTLSVGSMPSFASKPRRDSGTSFTADGELDEVMASLVLSSGAC
jgi:hypothetical protein